MAKIATIDVLKRAMKKVLVIEDEQILRKNILKILKAEGFESLGAADGYEGIDLARSENPDLIVCDIMMPELDGYGVLKTLQADRETAMIPFIFLTAKTDRADMRQGIELGADDYLVKPFDADELLRAIETRFKKQDLLLDRMASLSDELTRLQQFLNAKDGLMENLDRELRRPMSNIKVALTMLQNKNTPEARDRYLQILEEEFSREISLLNQVSEMQKLLTPENVNLLCQFNLLQGRS
ncbi:DNA-binding response regulator AraC family [Geitlerinema sp. FC II]|nr:DNA-binding response regulator AraC family [Geitlerinema sp. FC II]